MYSYKSGKLNQWRDMGVTEQQEAAELHQISLKTITKNRMVNVEKQSVDLTNIESALLAIVKALKAK